MYRCLLRAAGDGQSRSIDEILFEIPLLSLIGSITSDPGRSQAETSPIVDQFGNRKDESSRECPYADDSSAGIYVSDDCVEFLEDVTAVIFGRHRPSYLPSYFGREHAPRRAVTRRKNFHREAGLAAVELQLDSFSLQALPPKRTIAREGGVLSRHS